MIGILPEYHHGDIGKRGTVEGIEAVIAGREQSRPGLLLCRQKLRQRLHIGLAEFITEVIGPAPIRPELMRQNLNRCMAQPSLLRVSALCSGAWPGTG